MNPQPTAQEIAEASKEAAMAYRAYYAARDRKAPYVELADLRRKKDAAYQRHTELQDAARAAFAKKHGWRYSKKCSAGLYPVLDHVDLFLDPKGKRVARVTHSYAPIDAIERFAEANCLMAQRMPWSWWNPQQGCTAVLLMSADANEALR